MKTTRDLQTTTKKVKMLLLLAFAGFHYKDIHYFLVPGSLLGAIKNRLKVMSPILSEKTDNANSESQ